MRRIILIAVVLSWSSIFGLHSNSQPNPINKIVDSIPTAAKKLMKCYPAFVTGFAENHLIFKDGSKLLWDDGIKNKPFKTLLDDPDVKDMFVQALQDRSVFLNVKPGCK